MKLDPFNRKDPLAEAAKSILVNEDIAKIKKRVAQLKVGDKTNYGTVKEIGDDSITFKAPQTPKTKILFKQRKMGKPDYILMSLVKFTDDGKKLDKTFKEAIELEEKKVTESNEFVGAAAAAKVAGEDEFEFEGETFPTTIGLSIAKKIIGEDNPLDESNEFVGAAAAAKVAGEDEFEFDGETYPTKIGMDVAKKIVAKSLELAKKLAKTMGEETEISEGLGINFSKVSDDGLLAWTAWAKNQVKKNPEFKQDLKAAEREIKLRKLEEETEISEATDLVESAEQLDEVRTKPISRDEKNAISKLERLINSLPGIVKNLGYIHGEIDRGVSALTGPVDDIDNLGKLVKEIDKLSLNQKEYNLIKSNLKEETEELAEAEGEEFFTCEIHLKSSGQLYSTFYVLAKDLNSAKKKADKVFKELMKTSYPKDWPSYSKKFTLKVLKGDNIGELMP